MFVCGFVPFAMHHLWGNWQALQLSQWSSYLPFGGPGGQLLCEGLPGRYQRGMVVLLGAMFATICIASAMTVCQIGLAPTLAAVYGAPQMLVFVGFATVNGCATAFLLYLALTCESQHTLYRYGLSTGRLVQGTCGLLALLFLVRVLMADPHMAGHPLAPGIMVTALVWPFAAVCISPQTILGESCNDVQLRGY